MNQVIRKVNYLTIFPSFVLSRLTDLRQNTGSMNNQVQFSVLTFVIVLPHYLSTLLVIVTGAMVLFFLNIYWWWQVENNYLPRQHLLLSA